MIFTVQQDHRRKARLVIGGHIVDPGGHELYSITMKGVSARMLWSIASANNLEVLCGDIQSAHLYAKNTLKTYVNLMYLTGTSNLVPLLQCNSICIVYQLRQIDGIS
jgi:hypothetical protein